MPLFHDNAVRFFMRSAAWLVYKAGRGVRERNEVVYDLAEAHEVASPHAISNGPNLRQSDNFLEST